MSKRSRRRVDGQLGLLEAPPRTPLWRNLPESVRRRASELLGALVLQHAARAGARRGREGADE